MWCPRRASSEWPRPRSSIRAAAAAMKSDPRKAVSRSAHSRSQSSICSLLVFLQLFVHGYESAYTVFGRWNYDPSLLTEQDKNRSTQLSSHLPFFNVLRHCRFRLLFQRMCILDYAIRNTDRHMDNLLIRHVKGEEVQLAAIDNGLAFPVKHPESISRVRKFSFRWAQQPWAEYVRTKAEKMSNESKRFSAVGRGTAQRNAGETDACIRLQTLSRSQGHFTLRLVNKNLHLRAESHIFSVTGLKIKKKKVINLFTDPYNSKKISSFRIYFVTAIRPIAI